jgi:hypothetical protein
MAESQQGFQCSEYIIWNIGGIRRKWLHWFIWATTDDGEEKVVVEKQAYVFFAEEDLALQMKSVPRYCRGR